MKTYGFPDNDPLHEEEFIDRAKRKYTPLKKEDFKVNFLADGTGRARCQICSAVLSNINTAKKHYRNKHAPEPDFLVECTICHKRYKVEEYAREHLRRMHKISGFKSLVDSGYGKYVENDEALDEYGVDRGLQQSK